MIGDLSKEEVNRKILHVLAVCIPVLIFYSPRSLDISKWEVTIVIFSLLLISFLIEWIRFNNSAFSKIFFVLFGSMMRFEEKKQLTGATYILAGAYICSLISMSSEVASVSVFLCLTLFILGDAVAAIVGKAIGRIKVGDKTVEGGVACFLFCCLLFGIIFPNLPDFINCWAGDISIFQILIISSSIALLELFPVKWGAWTLNDNLYVPAISSLIAIAVQ